MIKFSLTVPSFNTKWWEDSRDELSKILLEENQEYWDQETDPQTNKKWSPLKPKYAELKSRKYPRAPILRRSGAMLDNTKIIPRNTRGIFAARMGTSYGAYHMRGTSRMVARPWLGIPNTFLPKMQKTVSQHVFRKSNRTFR